jgi:hypothetical protein
LPSANKLSANTNELKRPANAVSGFVWLNVLESAMTTSASTRAALAATLVV